MVYKPKDGIAHILQSQKTHSIFLNKIYDLEEEYRRDTFFSVHNKTLRLCCKDTLNLFSR